MHAILRQRPESGIIKAFEFGHLQMKIPDRYSAETLISHERALKLICQSNGTRNRCFITKAKLKHAALG